MLTTSLQARCGLCLSLLRLLVSIALQGRLSFVRIEIPHSDGVSCTMGGLHFVRITSIGPEEQDSIEGRIDGGQTVAWFWMNAKYTRERRYGLQRYYDSMAIILTSNDRRISWNPNPNSGNKWPLSLDRPDWDCPRASHNANRCPDNRRPLPVQYRPHC